MLGRSTRGLTIERIRNHKAIERIRNHKAMIVHLFQFPSPARASDRPMQEVEPWCWGHAFALPSGGIPRPSVGTVLLCYCRSFRECLQWRYRDAIAGYRLTRDAARVRRIQPCGGNGRGTRRAAVRFPLAQFLCQLRDASQACSS